MDSEMVEVPKEAFLALVEGFLSGNYRLYLTVEDMGEKKTFSCKEKGCGKPFGAWPPDEEHIVPRLEPAEGAVPRTYKCEGEGKHENTVYWLKEAAPKLFFTKT